MQKVLGEFYAIYMYYYYIGSTCKISKLEIQNHDRSNMLATVDRGEIIFYARMIGIGKRSKIILLIIFPPK
jgi:hypothetical protein